MDTQKLKDFFLKALNYSVDLMALAVILLALSIFYFSISLMSFTYELANVRRDMPGILTRIDSELDKTNKQILVVQKMLKNFEVTGKEFTEGINQGISSGIVNLPVNTVSNVGETIKNTAVKTGTTTYGFWNVLKDRLMFWKHPTVEAQSKPATNK